MSSAMLPQTSAQVKPARKRTAAPPVSWLDEAGRYDLTPHVTPGAFYVVKTYNERWEEIPIGRRTARVTSARTCTCEARNHPDCKHRKQVRFFQEFLTCRTCGTTPNPANDWAAAFHYDMGQPDLHLDSPLDVLDMVCLPCEVTRRRKGSGYTVPRTSHWRDYFTRAQAADIASVIESYRHRDPFYLPGRRV
jgi:hypothetical protein